MDYLNSLRVFNRLVNQQLLVFLQNLWFFVIVLQNLSITFFLDRNVVENESLIKFTNSTT